MKRRTLVIIVAVMLLGLVVAVAASFLHDGLSSRATPGKLETMVARKARRLALPANARLAQNPVLASAEELRDLPRQRREWKERNWRWPLPQAAGSASAGNAEPYGWGAVLDHRERRAVHRNASIFQWRRAWWHAGQLEAGSFYPPPSSSHRSGARRNGAL